MKLLQTKGYLLLIDEESRGIEFGEIGVNMRHSNLEPETRNIGGYGSDKFYWSHKKIIAYYPLTKEAKELDLPLLPPFEKDIERLAEEFYREFPNNPLDKPTWRYNKDINVHRKRKAFINGYKAAQSKGTFTLEDMKKAIEIAQTPIETGIGNYYPNVNEVLEQLSTKQLPVGFIPEPNDIGFMRYADISVGKKLYDKIMPPFKIITNSEGIEEIQGSYKY